MKYNKLRIFWFRLWHLRGFLTWKSWSGFGVSTDWPNDCWSKQVEKIKDIFQRHLPKDWVTEGPCFANGGVMVMYAWPKDDPYYKKMLAKANQEQPSSTPYR